MAEEKAASDARWSPSNKTEWAVLDAIRAHSYDYRNRGTKPTDPGWHACSCGWEGYWCDFQPHVAERVVATLAPTQAAASEDRCATCRHASHGEVCLNMASANDCGCRAGSAKASPDA